MRPSPVVSVYIDCQSPVGATLCLRVVTLCKLSDKVLMFCSARQRNPAQKTHTHVHENLQSYEVKVDKQRSYPSIYTRSVETYYIYTNITLGCVPSVASNSKNEHQVRGHFC